MSSFDPLKSTCSKEAPASRSIGVRIAYRRFGIAVMVLFLVARLLVCWFVPASQRNPPFS